MVSSQYWQAGAVVDFVYDGNGWSIVGVAKDNNSTNFLPLSGGSLTGNLTVGSSSIGTNGYVEGTWLRTTKATESAGNFATISGDGWIYKRAPANVLGDIGGQAKITANGILKGDGTGTITAADETEVELVNITPELIGAQPKITEMGFLMGGGGGNITSKSPVFMVNVLVHGSSDYHSPVDFTEIIDAYNKGCNVIAMLGGYFLYLIGVSQNEVMFSGVIKNDNIFQYMKLCCTSNNAWSGEFLDLISKYDPFPDASSSSTLPDIIVNLQDKTYRLEIGADSLQKKTDSLQEETDSLQEQIRNITLYSNRWTDSDPYTQTLEGNAASGPDVYLKVDIQPSEEIYDQLVADGVGYLAIKNVNGTLTAVAKGGKPSTDLSIQTTYNKVYNY